MKMDDNEYGMCYPHREHQLRYIDICMIHKCNLITCCDLCGEYYSSKGDLSLALVPRCTSGHEVHNNGLQTAEPDPSMTWIVESFRLMINHYGEIDAKSLIEKLVPVLAKLGYIEFKGAILKSKVIEDMVAFFGKDLLHKYGINKDDLLERTTIGKLFTPNNVYINIYLYLFLIKFLIGDFKKLIVCNFEYSTKLPFDKGPWLCMNKICPSHNLPVINECIRTVKQHIYGRFTCTICGYSYVQRFESYKDNSAKKFKIVDFGFLWRETVTKMLSENRSLQSISKKVGSYTQTIKKFKLNILDPARCKTKYSVETLQNEFEKFMYKKSFTSRGEVRKEFGVGKYDRLMKIKRDWMENLLPQCKVNLFKYRNYDQLDIEAYDSVLIAYEQLRVENSVQRITKIVILKHTSKLIFCRLTGIKKNCFIKTNKLLLELSENQETYLKRIFPIILNRFENSPRYITLTWSLIINRLHHGYKNASPEVIEWVMQKIEDYQSDRNI
ncbi:hypothetical protein GC096_01990 [Paenibacillus sp. LMG 31461]|uniref:Transposon Tn7 transposition protein TnsD C-terminal domain-containing protein n=2 Tax=Paenibacillus plantarum TaxID=2654975 RepID=A0ABX1X335_9BACL|nr:hypothetical protein [Paenibacillus plantarum]